MYLNSYKRNNFAIDCEHGIKCEVNRKLVCLLNGYINLNYD